MFTKDPITKLVINTDDTQYKTILALRESEKKAEDMLHRYDELAEDLSRIKTLLEKLAGTNNG